MKKKNLSVFLRQDRIVVGREKKTFFPHFLVQFPQEYEGLPLPLTLKSCSVNPSPPSVQNTLFINILLGRGQGECSPSFSDTEITRKIYNNTVGTSNSIYNTHANMPGPAPDALLPSPEWLLNEKHHQRAHILCKGVLPYSCTQKLSSMFITIVPKQWCRYLTGYCTGYSLRSFVFTESFCLFEAGLDPQWCEKALVPRLKRVLQRFQVFITKLGCSVFQAGHRETGIFSTAQT